MLTKTDLKNIGVLINNSKDEILNTMDMKFENFEEEMDEKFTQQRSDFFERIDPILKEVTTNREERIINDERITKLEEATFQ